MPLRAVPRALQGCAVLALALCARGQGLTERVSVGSLGEQGDATSGLSSSASADGRYVAFDSSASTLVPGDTNGNSDVFLRDRASGLTWRVSVGPGGVQANGFSGFCSLSADGGAVAFTSQASNLVPGDTNGFSDVFVVDLQSGQLARVSVAAGGAQASEGSLDGELSADGRFVAYQSLAADLVPGDTNGFDDVFVHDRQTGQVVRASVGAAGGQGSGWSGAPSISADGRYVAFASRAPDLVPGDTNGVEDVFVKDLVTGTLVRASTDSAGGQASLGGSDAALSGDGRCVAFTSLSADLVGGDTNGLVDVFVKDLVSGATRRASVGSSGQQANGQSIEPALSTDGALVAFRSFAANLVPGDTNSVSDIFVRDLASGITLRASVASDGAQANSHSERARFAPGAAWLTFTSFASDLVPGDTNGKWDVFLRALPELPRTYCVSQPSSAGCLPATGFAGQPSASAGAGFAIHVADADPGRTALLVYGLGGPAAMPFGNGTLCVAPPLRRTPPQLTAGPAPCGGAAALDFNAWIASGADPALVPGQLVHAQWWLRDPGDPFGAILSDALELAIGP